MQANWNTDHFLKRRGEEEGNEELFYFPVNMQLLIKEKQIPLYATKEDDIQVSSG